jgi:hypothetical protein
VGGRGEMSSVLLWGKTFWEGKSLKGAVAGHFCVIKVGREIGKKLQYKITNG